MLRVVQSVFVGAEFVNGWMWIYGVDFIEAGLETGVRRPIMPVE